MFLQYTCLLYTSFSVNFNVCPNFWLTLSTTSFQAVFKFGSDSIKVFQFLSLKTHDHKPRKRSYKAEIDKDNAYGKTAIRYKP